MKMLIEITESYTTGICTVWQTEHHRLGRRFTIYDPESILSPTQYSAFLKGRYSFRVDADLIFAHCR
jgi:hypothetical protein